MSRIFTKYDLFLESKNQKKSILQRIENLSGKKGDLAEAIKIYEQIITYQRIDEGILNEGLYDYFTNKVSGMYYKMFGEKSAEDLVKDENAKKEVEKCSKELHDQGVTKGNLFPKLVELVKNKVLPISLAAAISFMSFNGIEAKNTNPTKEEQKFRKELVIDQKAPNKTVNIDRGIQPDFTGPTDLKPVKLQEIKNIKVDSSKTFNPNQPYSKIRSANLDMRGDNQNVIVIEKYEYDNWWDFTKNGWKATDDGLETLCKTRTKNGELFHEVGIRVVGTDPVQNATFLYNWLKTNLPNGNSDPSFAKEVHKKIFDQMQGGFAHRLVVGEIEKFKPSDLDDNGNLRRDTLKIDVLDDFFSGELLPTQVEGRDKDFCSLGLRLGPESLNSERADKNKPSIPVLTVNLVMGKDDASGNTPLYETTYIVFSLTDEEEKALADKEKQEREERYQKSLEEWKNRNPKKD